VEPNIMKKCRNREYIKALMLYSAQQANILPVTSTCNVNCIFCSNRQNPPGVETYTISPRALDDIEECLQFMDDRRPVIIGESVTRICEGEPFTHPHIKDVLRLVRRRLPGSLVKITTNGGLLDKNMVSFLSSLEKVVVNLSLNSSNPGVRAELMGDKMAGRAVKCVRLLKEANVEFHGSVVAMPHCFGYADLEETIGYLAGEGAKTVRVFIPGYTRTAPDVLRFPPDLPVRVRNLVSMLRNRLEVPVMCEPPVLNNLSPEVAGVMPGSPARRAGVKTGDIIEMIDGYRPYSRVDAFNRLRNSSSPEVVLKRGKDIFTCCLDKAAGESPGVVMEYDLGPEWKDVGRPARHHRAEKVLVITSYLAREVVSLGMNIFCGGLQWKTVPAPNRFFGGSIAAAGLLVVEDMIEAVKAFNCAHPRWQPDLVLLPPVAFDHRGRDLTGRSYREVGEKTGLPVEIL